MGSRLAISIQDGTRNRKRTGHNSKTFALPSLSETAHPKPPVRSSRPLLVGVYRLSDKLSLGSAARKSLGLSLLPGPLVGVLRSSFCIERRKSGLTTRGRGDDEGSVLTMKGRERTVLTEGFRRCARPRYTVIPLRVPEWRNWQTRGTQNPEKLTLRVGSTPTSGTIKSVPFTHLARSPLQTVLFAATPVGQPWGNSRRSHEAGRGGPTAQRPTCRSSCVALVARWPAG